MSSTDVTDEEWTLIAIPLYWQMKTRTEYVMAATRASINELLATREGQQQGAEMTSDDMNMKQKLRESMDSAIETLKLYRDHGIEPGSGTRALLENDLFQALRRSDQYRQRILGDIARWMDRNMPADSYGSRQKVDDWIAARRKEQREGAAE